jgi:hypothetical protein
MGPGKAPKKSFQDFENAVIADGDRGDFLRDRKNSCSACRHREGTICVPLPILPGRGIFIARELMFVV